MVLKSSPHSLAPVLWRLGAMQRAHAARHSHAALRFEESFTDPVTVEGIPDLGDGKELLLRKGSILDCETGGWIWPAAVALCKWLKAAAARDELQNAKVLELGCGTGAAGLYAAAVGASQVTLTDINPAVLRLAEANVELNRKLWKESTKVQVVSLPWGDSADSLGPHHLVIGSDLVYAVGVESELCWTLSEQLSLYDGCKIVLSHENRPVVKRSKEDPQPAEDNTLDLFKAEAAKVGLEAIHIGEEGRVSILEVRLANGAEKE